MSCSQSNECHLPNRLHWKAALVALLNCGGFIGSGPKLVVEVTFLTWTDDGLLRQVVYQGLREDKLASAVKLERP